MPIDPAFLESHISVTRPTETIKGSLPQKASRIGQPPDTIGSGNELALLDKYEKTKPSEPAFVKGPPDKQYHLEDVFSPEDIRQIHENKANAYKALEEKAKMTPLTDEEKQALADKNYGEGASKKERILHLVVGPPGAGKSSIVVNPLAEKYGAKVIDSDDIKPQIPGFAKGYGTDAVHPESADVANRMYIKGLQNGDNLVYPIIGRDEKTLTQIINSAKNDYGYKVGLHLVDLPPDEAAQRGFARTKIERADGTRQMTNPQYALNVVGDLPKKVFESAIQRPGLVDAHSHYDNNVPFGSEAIHVGSQGEIPTTD